MTVEEMASQARSSQQAKGGTDQGLPPRQGALLPHTATQRISTSAPDQPSSPQNIRQGAPGLAHGGYCYRVCGRQQGMVNNWLVCDGGTNQENNPTVKITGYSSRRPESESQHPW